MSLPLPSQDFAQAEKRGEPRNRVLLAGTLVFDRANQTPACTIRNLTAKGAAVRLESGLPLPHTLTLVETRSGKAHDARVVWRRGGFLGLALDHTRDLRDAAPTDPLRRLWSVNQLR